MTTAPVCARAHAVLRDGDIRLRPPRLSRNYAERGEAPPHSAMRVATARAVSAAARAAEDKEQPARAGRRRRAAPARGARGEPRAQKADGVSSVGARPPASTHRSSRGGPRQTTSPPDVDGRGARAEGRQRLRHACGRPCRRSRVGDMAVGRVDDEEEESPATARAAATRRQQRRVRSGARAAGARRARVAAARRSRSSSAAGARIAPPRSASR